MSERYTRLFALEENLYSAGSPVVISAGALLKDNKTGGVLAQLKIKNISSKGIKAAVVRLTTSDAFGKAIEGTVEKEYLDLAVPRDGEFGQKALIALPNAAARAFTAVVTCVGFADGTVWNYAGAEQTALPRPKPLAGVLGDPELQKQYRLKYGTKAQVFPEEYKDIWFCTCGALCRADEAFCHTCGQKRAVLESFDREALTAEKDERLVREAAARKRLEDEAAAARRKAEEERAAAAAKKAERARTAARRAKKIAGIVLLAACVCFVAILLIRSVIIPKMKLSEAMDMIDAGEYDSAYALLEELGEDEAIAASKYDRAMECIDAQDYKTAFALLSGLNYKDSKEKQESIRPQYYEALHMKANVGDTVFFGSYEQDNDTSNGKEPIEWLVLEKEENKLLVISLYALDCQPYNTEYINITWEKCSLRQWLNEEFYHAAFTESERASIPAVAVTAGKNSTLAISAGNDTQDNVFLLSRNEVKEYFDEENSIVHGATPYAVAEGTIVNDDGNCAWWLRTPGISLYFAVIADNSGRTYRNGAEVKSAEVAVRPAMWIDLSN